MFIPPGTDAYTGCTGYVQAWRVGVMRHNQNQHSATPEKSGSLVSGVFVLLISSIVVKAIGLFFKIPVSYLLGDEGMGYFNTAYTIYTWLYILSTAGVPVAVSIMVSGSLARGETELALHYRKTALRAFALIGFAGTFLLLAFAAPLARFVGSPDSFAAIIAIAPTLLFVCVSSVLRGYSQGEKSMTPTAVSQVIESVGKLMPGILLAFLASRRGLSLPMIAGWAVFGVTAGALMSMLYLLFRRKTIKKNPDEHLSLPSTRETLRRLMRIAVPVTVSASVMSLTNLIDLGMMMRRLQEIGYTSAQATALYGNYTTLVVPLFNLPSVLIYPIAYTIVPQIASCRSAGLEEKGREIAGLSLRLTTALSVPCAVGMGVFSYQILSMIFRESSALLAAPYLRVISPAVVFICILAVTNSLLQAYGHHNKPILSMLAGCAVKLIAGYILMGIPSVGMMGAPIGTLLCYITVGCLNLFFTVKCIKTPLPIGRFMILPLLSSVCSIVPVAWLDNVVRVKIPGGIATAASIAVCAVLYVVFAFLFGVIRVDDLQKIPQLSKVITRFGRKKAKNTL